MSWLTPADLQVLEVAKLIRGGMSFTEAMAQIGVQWSPTTFGHNVKRILENPVLRNSIGRTGRATLQHAVRAVGGEAVVAAGTTAMAAISTTALIIGAVVLVGAALAGGYYWANYGGDKPTKAGPRGDKESRMARGDIPATPENTPTPTDAKPNSSQPRSLDISGDWALRWNWSVTEVIFVGQLSGSGNQWSFQGTLDSGGNYEWRPAKGSASVQCDLNGDPNSSSAPDHLSCTATFADGSWEADADGEIQVLSFDGKYKFEFEGRGTGTNTKGEKAGIDHLDLSPKND